MQMGFHWITPPSPYQGLTAIRGDDFCISLKKKNSDANKLKAPI